LTTMTILILAGVGQLVLALGSLAIPLVLGWREHTAALPNLTRQVFWTYAGYIWATNVSFGLLSALAPGALLDGSLLARCVCAFITLYWGARVVIQFTYFDRSEAPQGPIYTLGEAALVLLFVSLTAIYGSISAGVL
jgi:hypothetical protein